MNSKTFLAVVCDELLSELFCVGVYTVNPKIKIRTEWSNMTH